MAEALIAVPIIGMVVSSQSRPATATTVWIDLLAQNQVALGDLIVIESPEQALIGIVVDIERVAESSTNERTRRATSQSTCAKLDILSASDMRQRPPDGTTARLPHPHEVTELLAEARRIPRDQRVPLGVIPLQEGFAPVSLDLRRVVGPIATSMLITGSAGSYKSSAGMLAALGIQEASQGRVALVIVNSKGNDFLFADYGRQLWAEKLSLTPLSARDLAIYSALGYPEPPALQHVTAFVPQASDPRWQSMRPMNFPRTHLYQLSPEIAIRYASAPTDDDERPSTVVTRQCIEEVAGPFAQECGATSLYELVEALEAEFVELGARERWRNQFLTMTVGAALRQLRAALRDLGPILGETGQSATAVFPAQQLANGGTWIVDVAPLPQRAAQAVLDALVNDLWNAKTRGIIPHQLGLVLVCDELNRFATAGPTASKLAAIVRDQRHRHFALIGLAQEMSTLHPHMLQSADTRWIGTTRSLELAHEVYNHLPPHVRGQLHRLTAGQRVLDAWPLVQPLIMEIPFPSWLIADEGLAVVEAWQKRQT